MITPYGYDNAFLMLAVGICLLAVAATVPGAVWTTLFTVLGIILIAFTLWFFRDPARPLAPAAAADAAIVVAPADGTVTEIVTEDYVQAFRGPATRITIFLSPVNLHVNRYPVGGVVRTVEYVPGEYLMAYNPKASERNERSIITMDTPNGTLIFKQITGFLARRIVYDCAAGYSAQPGERFGMMKFGSRMDIIVATSTDVHVRVGQRVRSAHTVLATLHGNSEAAA